MAIHGKYISDDSTRIRVVRGDDDELIRVFFHEELYAPFKKLYEYAELLTAGVDVSEIPDRLETCFDWLSALTIETGRYGWLFSIALVGWIIHLVKRQISIGKFAYESVGWGDRGFGEGPFGGGTRIVEHPVEG